MKSLLKIEEAFLFALAIYFNTLLPFPTWYFWALFLLPDISMLGYLANPRIAAICYNIAHHKGLALAVFFAGTFLIIPELTLAGVVLFGHSSFDRIVGYGLKFSDDFKNTHLGWIGKGN